MLESNYPNPLQQLASGALPEDVGIGAAFLPPDVLLALEELRRASIAPATAGQRALEFCRRMRATSAAEFDASSLRNLAYNWVETLSFVESPDSYLLAVLETWERVKKPFRDRFAMSTILAESFPSSPVVSSVMQTWGYRDSLMPKLLRICEELQRAQGRESTFFVSIAKMAQSGLNTNKTRVSRLLKLLCFDSVLRLEVPGQRWGKNSGNPPGKYLAGQYVFPLVQAELPPAPMPAQQKVTPLPPPVAPPPPPPPADQISRTPPPPPAAPVTSPPAPPEPVEDGWSDEDTTPDDYEECDQEANAESRICALLDRAKAAGIGG